MRIKYKTKPYSKEVEVGDWVGTGNTKELYAYKVTSLGFRSGKKTVKVAYEKRIDYHETSKYKVVAPGRPDIKYLE